MKSQLFFAALICSLFCRFSPASAQNMQYVSNSLIRVATTTVEAGTNNNPILRLAITVSGTNNSLILNEIRLGIPAANQWIRSVHVRYTGDSNQFSEFASGIGSIVTDPNTNEWVLQTDFPLFPLTTQYFWVTYDMSLCTPSSTVVGGTLNSFKLSGVNRTPSNPNPPGQATSTIPQNPKFISIGNGYWQFGNNWANGEVPCDNTTIPVVINSNIEVITNVQVGNRITVNLGKTLKVNGGELVLGNGNTDTRLFLDGKVRVENGVFHVRGNTSSVNSSQMEITGGVFRSGDAGGDNKNLILSSDVNITGGKLEANGSLTFATLSELTMSAGEIVVDPNGGSAGKSSSSGLGINVLPNLSGGTITIVDPPFNGTGEVYSYNGPVGAAFGGTLIIGGTTGTNTSTSSVGFEVFGGNMPVNNLIINGGRKSNFRHTSFDGRFYAGNVTINSGKELEMLTSADLVTGTTLVNNGICSACALSFASISTVTSLPNPASNAQTVSGTGFFKISAADPDPTNQADNKIRRLFVNHTQASPGLIVHMPLTVTEDFWPEGGKTTLTGNHLLTIGESASNPGIVNDATRSGGAFPTGWVTTALRRWTKTAGVPTGYNEAAIFPVGDTERRRHFYLSHPSGVATPGTLTVQFVTEDPGISGFPLNWGGKLMVSASPTGYWKVTNNGVSGTYNVMGNGNGFQNRTGDNIGFTEEMSVMRRTNGVWAAAEGEPKTPTGLDRLRSEGFSTYGDYGISGTAVLFSTPKTYSSVATAQPQTAAIDAGSSFISVVRVDVEVFGTQNNLQMTELVFNTNGTTNTFDLRNARAYYTGTSPDFTNTTPFGNVSANPNGTITFTGSQELAGGNVLTKNYFWLAYDIRYCAPTGNVVDGELVSIKVGATTYTPVSGNPGAGRSVNAFGLFNYQTVADGNWNNFDIWNDGCIPRNVINAVAIGHNVTVTGNAETDGTVTLQAGKKLTIATGGTLTVGLPGGDNNLFLTQTGSTVEIAGGTFNLNGSISFAGATFAMSAGNFNIDPNNGTSGVSGGTVLNFPSTATLNVTGGNITLVDPPFGTGIYSLGFLSGTNLFNLNATLTLGGSTSINTSANADGFRINTGGTTRGLTFANLVVNGGRKSDNRQVWVDGGYLYCGNLTVNVGCELEMRDGGSASEVAVSGNLVNNGVVSIPSNRRLVFHGGLTVNPLFYQNATTGHTLSGTGLFKLLASDPDPAQQTDQQLGQLAVYNTAASPGLNCQIPLIVVNTLRLSAGRINLIAPNRLRLGTVAGVGTLADLAATGWVNGQFQRWTKAAGTAYGVTDNFGYFPVGDALARRLIQVAFPSGGPTASGVLSAQFNNTSPGTAGLPITWGGVSVSGTSATGFWQIGSEGASGAYIVRADATGFADCSGAALSTPGSVRLIKRPNSGAWSAAEGSANTPAALNAVEGTGFSTFSEFGIGLNQGLTADCKNIAVSLSGSSVSVAASDLNNNSAGCGSLSFSVAGQNTISFNCSQVGAPQSITLTVTDGQSNTTATCNATVTVTENVPPTIACPPNTTVAAGPSCTGQVGAYTLLSKSDNCTAGGSIAEQPQSPAATTPLSGHNTAQTVTLTANDGNGNTQTCQFTVTLKDVTKPTIACPPNTTVAAGPSCTGQVGAYALLSKSDNCTASGSITEQPQSPAATTVLSGHNTAQTVTLTANDGNGNTQTCQFTVTLKDVTKPTIDCPPNTTVAAGPSCTGQIGAYTLLSKSDNCTASGSIAEQPQSPAATTVFSGHNTAQTVTLTANDGNGNTQTCQFTVTLKDVTKPTIDCPPNTTVAAGSSCTGQIGSYALLSKSDNCTASGSIAEQPQSPAATTVLSGHNTAQTVTLTANDGNGNTQTCQFTVTLKDVTKPTIDCPPNITVAAGPSCTGQVGAYTLLSKSDNCTASGSIAEQPQSPAATTVLSGHNTAQTVTLTANDGNGNTETCQFTVTLKDVTKPTIACPPNTTVAAGPSCTGQVGAYALLSKSDNCTASGSITEQPQSPAATTVLSGHNTAQTVTLTANDGNGNTQTCQFTVTLKDVTKPTIDCPPNTTVAAGPSCTSQIGAYTLLSKSDNCTASGSIAEQPQSPAATTVFSGHNTAQTVTLTANDGNGNTQTCQFTVTLKDVTKPTIACPANTTVAAGPSCTSQVGAYALLSKSDNCTASGSIAEQPQSPAATTVFSGHNTAQTVTLTANDGNGNTQTCQFTVTLKDVTKPTIACPANTITINTNAGSSCEITIPDYITSLAATDNCSAVVEAQSIPAGAYTTGVSDGATITVNYTATDGATPANTTTCTVTITVNDDDKPTFTCPTPTLVLNTTGGENCQVTIPDLVALVTDAADNCALKTTNPITQSVAAGNYNGVSDGMTIPVVVTVTDNASPANSETCTITFTVNDDDKPTFTCPTPTLVLNTTGGENCQVVIPDLVALVTNAADNCALKTTNPITQSIAAGNYNGVSDGMIIPVVVTVTDNASPANSETCTINFTVNDDDKPTFTCPTPTLVLNTTGGENCQVVIPDLVALVTNAADNCALKTTNPITQSVAAGDYNGVSDGMTIPIVVTVTDNASPANSETCTINFTVNDDDAPTVSCPQNTTILNTITGNTCAISVPNYVAILSPTDNCSASGSIVEAQDIPAGTYSTGIYHGAVVTVNYTATDGASPANTTTCTVSITVNAPEAEVRGNGVAIADGDNSPDLLDHTNFGDTFPNTNLTRTFTVQNTGGLPLTISSIISSNNVNFMVGALSVNPIPAGQSATFDVTFNAAALGTYPSTLTINNNDCNEGVYDFAIVAEITCSTPAFSPCLGPQTANTAAGLCSAVVTYAPTVTGIPAPTLTYVFTGATVGSGSGTGSGSTFNKGITNVVITAVNVCGSITCSFTVTVTDNQDPTIVCPNAIIRNTDANQCTSVVTYAPTVSDNCPSATFILVSGPASGAAFPKGSTLVTLKAVDAAGRMSGNCMFSVTVNDNHLPSITCPANLIRSTDAGQCGAVVAYTNPTYSDNCPLDGPAGLNHLMGGLSNSTFPKGITAITWQATDGAGLTKTCSFTITVNDTQKPNITCPANQTRSTGFGLCSAVVTYPTPTGSDNCGLPTGQPMWISGGTMPVASGANSIATFPKGINTVTWRATDGAGLTNTCTFRVTVNDTEAPALTCPVPMNLFTATNTCNAVGTYTNPTFTDNCAPTMGTATRISGLVSGSAFPLGNSNVVFQATDAAGNTRRCTMVITVTDNQPPAITCPISVVVNGTGSPCSATVFYGSATASDNCAGTLTPFLATGLTSGSSFPVGVTTNTFRAVAPNGQSAECTFSVTVNCGSGMSNAGLEDRDKDLEALQTMIHKTSLGLTIAPNPTTYAVTMTMEGVDANGGTLLVFDQIGRLVQQQAIASDQRTTTLQVAEFAPGLYRIMLKTDDGMVTKTLVVVKE